jgi:anti-anti-sigma factor
MSIQVKSRREGDAVVIAASGRIDATSSGELESAVNEQLKDKTVLKVVLDLNDVNYVSSSGLRVFLLAVKMIKARNGKLFLCGVVPAIMDILKMSGFLSFLTIADKVEDCL